MGPPYTLYHTCRYFSWGLSFAAPAVVLGGARTQGLALLLRPSVTQTRQKISALLCPCNGCCSPQNSNQTITPTTLSPLKSARTPGAASFMLIAPHHKEEIHSVHHIISFLTCRRLVHEQAHDEQSTCGKIMQPGEARYDTNDHSTHRE